MFKCDSNLIIYAGELIILNVDNQYTTGKGNVLLFENSTPRFMTSMYKKSLLRLTEKA